jgi:hypothetical protein
VVPWEKGALDEREISFRLQGVLELHSEIPVVTSDWVQACHQTRQRVAFNNYLLPALRECSISFTNLNRRQRAAYQRSIEELGGTVAADMSKHCTHLVVGDTSKMSAKLKCAYMRKFVINVRRELSGMPLILRFSAEQPMTGRFLWCRLHGYLRL